MPKPEFESPYFAAIDLGSNSFHMLVVRVDGETTEVVDREKQMVQIARGLQKNGKLDEDAQERALSCLTMFAERLRDIPKSQIRAVGTKTLRSAKNSSRFLNAAEDALGVKIQIISGYEEARLVYAGLASTIEITDQRLVIDIGGGSTEFVIGEKNEPKLLESLAMGCVSFTEDYIWKHGGITKATMRKAYLAACAELEEIRKNYLKAGWSIAYGTSGTMRAAADLLAEKDGGAIITRESLNQLIKQIIDEGELTAPGVPKLRREVLPAGLAIIQAVCDQLKIENIHVADASLKEGLIFDTIGRFSNKDSRVETVHRMMHQYRIDTDQAERVSSTSVNLFKQLDSPILTGVSRTKILCWAAQLHEVGLSISHSGFHHHGYYILRHSDLAGFGRYEQFILSNLVRSHRKKLSDDRIIGLDSAAFEAFTPLLVCLRLAALLHRRREPLEEMPKIAQKKGEYKLTFSEKWLQDHPLTHEGLVQEKRQLNKIGIELNILSH